MMPSFRIMPAIALLAMVGLTGCQSVTSGVSSVFPTGTSIKGEAQWPFAANEGDVVFVSLQDGTRTIVAQELLPTSGAKHVPFDLVPANADAQRCAQGGCRYSARLMRGSQLLASGEASYLGTGVARIALSPAGAIPGGEPSLPKPVYR